MRFFFDRCSPRQVARMLEQFDRDHNVKHQDDDLRFEPDSPDVHIINTLAADDPKWVWITADLSQRKNPAERKALRDSGMTIFFFRFPSKKGISPHLQALKFLAVWPALVSAAETAREPTAFEIPFGHISKDKIIDKINRLCATRDLS